MKLNRAEAFTEPAQKIRLALSDFTDEDGAPTVVAASAGRFGRKTGGWAVGGEWLEGEVASGVTKTDRTHFGFPVPQNYVAGSDITVSIVCRVSVAATTSATINCQGYKSNDNAGAGGALQAGAAQSINSAVWATKTFTITGATLNPGDVLDFYVEAIVNDGGGATGAKAQIGGVYFSTTTQM